jgi:VIT1/CCC1 family predicted Fe2+/Mn2+ transporter
MVAKIATGEIEEELSQAQGSVLAEYLEAEEESQESSEAVVEEEPCPVFSK